MKSKLSAKIMDIFEEKSASFGAVLEKFADNDKALVDLKSALTAKAIEIFDENRVMLHDLVSGS